jgi:methyl-accepting chemotaxis protein
MKLRTKLIGGFSIIALFTVGVGIIGYCGIVRFSSSSETLTQAESVSSEMLQKEIAHLNWVHKAGEFQRNESATRVEVEKDNHKCGFGQWYYSEHRKQAEVIIPDIAPTLSRIESPHAALHSSAKELETILQRGRGSQKEAMHFYETVTLAELKTMQQLFEEIRSKVAADVEKRRRAAESDAASAQFMMVVGIVVSVIIALTLGTILTLLVIKPLSKIAGAADEIATGDINQKIDINSKDEIGSLAESFRQLIDYIKAVASSADAIARGDITSTVEARSDKDALGRSFQQLQRELKRVIGEAGELVKCADGGDLKVRCDAASFQGAYRELVSGMNGMMDAMVAPINEAADVLERVAAQDLSVRMRGKYRGDFAKIKESMNTAVNNLDQALLQVTVLRRSAEMTRACS